MAQLAWSCAVSSKSPPVLCCMLAEEAVATVPAVSRLFLPSSASGLTRLKQAQSNRASCRKRWRPVSCNAAADDDASQDFGGQPLPLTKGNKKAVHFVGIGGAGLSALALLALQQGWRVSGSDAVDGERLRVLESAGATVHVGHSPEFLRLGDQGELVDLVVVSSAVRPDNEEIVAAHAKEIPVLKRGEWLGRLTSEYELIAVAGSHGKTTTSAMLALALQSVGEDITAVIGAVVPQLAGGSNAVVGKGQYFVLEADEYDGCFLSLRPSIAVITNVEWEHVDIFPNESAVRDAFQSFAERIRPGGTLLVCGDAAGSRQVARALAQSEGAHNDDEDDDDDDVDRDIVDPGITTLPYFRHALAAGRRNAKRLATAGQAGATCQRQVYTYGVSEGNDWQATMLAPNVQGGTDFVVVHAGQPMARVSLQVPGVHNVLNALAAISASALVRAAREDLPASAGSGAEVQLARLREGAGAAGAALEHFSGVRRRFERLGRARSCVVYDDYAHHPTEVVATLQGARQRCNRQPLWVVFQPHTYSRLARLLSDFASAFSAADRVIITEVYAARETDTLGVSGSDLAEAIKDTPALYIAKQEDVEERLLWEILAYDNGVGERRGDIVLLTLGAGPS